MDVLVLDVGGTTVKMLATDADGPRQFESGEDMTPEAMVDEVQRATADWHYDVMSLGYPGTVDGDRTRAEPGNLGDGWVGFDFEKAFGKPVRIVNDAVMQALGGYDGGRMLFLGLGTGLGSALVTEHVVDPARARLPAVHGEARPCSIGSARTDSRRTATRRGGGARPQSSRCCARRSAADYVVLGGGNATRVEHAARRGRGAAATTTRSRAGSGCGKRWWSRTTASRRRCGGWCDEIHGAGHRLRRHDRARRQGRRRDRRRPAAGAGGGHAGWSWSPGRELEDLFNTFAAPDAVRSDRRRERRAALRSG